MEQTNMSLNESVTPTDIGTISTNILGTPYNCGYPISPLVNLQRSKLLATKNSKLHSDIKYVAVNNKGHILGFYDRPVYSGDWIDADVILGSAIWTVKPNSKATLINVLTYNNIDLEETLMSSGYFEQVLLRTQFLAPNRLWESRLNEGRHYRAICFDGQEIQIPSTFKYLTIDDDGNTHIFKEKPNYMTTGHWKGPGKVKVAQAIWSENYAFPIYASNLIIKLFGVSDVCDITDKMVSGWNIDTLAFNQLWSKYAGRDDAKNLTDNVPGSKYIKDSLSAKTSNVIEFTFEDSYELPNYFTWAAIDKDGSLNIFSDKPKVMRGVWGADDKTNIGHVELDDGVSNQEIEELSWKLSNIRARKFLMYHNDIIKGIYIDKEAIDELLKEGIMESTITIQNDDIEIPDGFTHIAIDANTDISAFKEEPKLDGDEWVGKGKQQIGVAIWNFSKLPSKPKSMAEAKPQIKEILDQFKYEIDDDLNLQNKLDSSGYFKYFFAKYNKIEKL